MFRLARLSKAAVSFRTVATTVAVAGGLCAVASFSTCAPASFTVRSDLDNRHEHSHRYNKRETYEGVMKLLNKHDDDAEITWRAARAAYALADDPETPKGEKEALFREALKLIQEAVRLNPDLSEAHRWYGTILAGLGPYQSTKEYIANTFVIHSHWMEATTINPSDATAHHLLGRWSYDVAMMSWFTRNIARTLFAEPPSSSIEEALEHFERAESISPGFWKKNQVMIAQCMKQLGRKEEAREWAQKATQIRTLTHEDEEAEAEAQKLLSSLG